MPIVILRECNEHLYCYIAKLDLEAKVTGMEFDRHDYWGGRVELEGGKAYYISPQAGKPAFPVSLRATRSEP
ncbi:NifT/FixU family protein [Pectobacteriaceae bacterium CE70]|uniref:Putative nitrogen fixation protein NifT n=1 Tax=Serratia sp. (strain ATCC 39006) TaxID=104623 RepID=A0A2I5T406_SERS3|nr:MULTISPECIES: NifT/FixU family protein [Enterobacterales]WJV57811.1 NifT/FixU family protein [Pectobacteriaceae bacterium C111]WJV62122.1 NifT/FixU family protein [Pectobacteriaceae bacterium C52]WJV66401.1 NifT/FixU family protein [Pectobacteriaceae bacterium CE70]WJY10407.1 NifT/FixU family protein [Pectobacteriaceae bacterium C80]WJY15544.1 NifT/FixU family protein [Pectobacteriaceae bacterium CE90]